MDFGLFGIGAWELLVIGLLALIVLGPKQMILLARKAGELLRQFQQIWQEASKTIDKEIRVLEEETGDIGSIGKQIESLAKDVKSAMAVNLPGIGAPPKRQPSNGSAPGPASSEPPAVPSPSPAWTASPATPASPAPSDPPSTTEPANPSSNQPTGQPPGQSNTQSSGRPTTGSPTRYPAWTSKPDK